MNREESLYELKPADFTAARDALAKELNTAGDKERAARVKALRKPSVAAWAVNQLSRRYPDDLQAAMKAGDALREAHRKLADPAAMRERAAEHRRAVGSLVDKASWLLQKEGHKVEGGVLEKIRETLTATAADDEGRELVRSGRLTKELRHAGFGGGIEAAAAARKPAARKDDRKAKQAQALEDEAERLAAEADEAERAARDARRAADEAETDARRARRKAQQAEERARKARE